MISPMRVGAVYAGCNLSFCTKLSSLQTIVLSGGIPWNSMRFFIFEGIIKRYRTLSIFWVVNYPALLAHGFAPAAAFLRRLTEKHDDSDADFWWTAVGI